MKSSNSIAASNNSQKEKKKLSNQIVCVKVLQLRKIEFLFIFLFSFIEMKHVKWKISTHLTNEIAFIAIPLYNQRIERYNMYICICLEKRLPLYVHVILERTIDESILKYVIDKMSFIKKAISILYYSHVPTSSSYKLRFYSHMISLDHILNWTQHKK